MRQIHGTKAPDRFIQETEFKERVTEMLQAVASGESIAIIRNGRKVARLVPTEETFLDSEEERERRRQAVDKLLEARKGWKKVNASLEEILEWRYARE